MADDMQEPPAPDMPGAGTELAEVKRAAPMAVAVLSDDEIRRTWRIASALAQSGMFKDARQAEQAFAKILIGRDLGLTPAQAMTGIHIVEGKPELAAVTLAGFVGKREGYDYRVRVHTDTACEIEFFREKDSLGISTFTIEDAETAGIAKKDNYKKWPRNMLYARAMSNGVRWYCPEVVGGLAVYVEGELDHRELVGGASDPEPVGIDLGPKVEAVLTRASELGHAGLADRATAEMAVGGMSPKDVEAWVGAAHTELDALEPADAEVVSDGAVTAEFHDEVRNLPDTEALLARANELADQAVAAHDSDNEELAGALEAEAEALRDAAGPVENPEQSELEV